MTKVVLFSGGRTSGLMLRRMLNTREDFITCFCNTGKERLETLDFVHEVETRWRVPIVWLEYHRVAASTISPGIFPTERRNQNLAKSASNGEKVHWFREVNAQTASRKGEPFDELLRWTSVLPNVVSRICSTQLKIRTAMRYLFSLGIKEYAPFIGIRKDEEHRATQILATCDSFEHPRFPLIESNINEMDVARFWRESDFDLRLMSYEGNCDLCFLKSKWKRKLLIKENPGMVDWWKNWEAAKATATPNGKMFRMGEPYAQLEIEANTPDPQGEFCFTPPSDQDIPCSCAERGFGVDDAD